MNFKFIHAADIHLDSPLQGLERYEGAPVEYVRGATRKALQNMVELAMGENVDFVLISGDLYNGDWRDYNVGLFFTSQMARLREAGIKVFIIRGNHDAASRLTRSLRLPENVRDLSTNSPETITLDDLGVVLHGQGFNSRAVTEDLSRSYPEPLKDYFNIGLLHTCATGREGHEPYAPCDLNYIKNKGYDYWALGHVHKREIINEHPWIVFPGNLQGRHIREAGVKGCTLVRVRDGRVETVKERAVDVLRWNLCRVDGAGAATYDEVLERAERKIEEALGHSEGRLLALRISIVGSCDVHGKLAADPGRLHNNLRAIAADRGLGNVWLEKIKLETTPPTRTEEVPEGHPVASLLEYFRELRSDEQLLKELLTEMERDLNALPADLSKDGEMTPEEIKYMEEMFPQVEELLLTRLLQKEEMG